jgi:NADPH-dependent curcumin reductase CurA
MSYQSIILKQYPTAAIDGSTFEQVTVDEAPLAPGQFRVKVTHISLDPAMRGWVSPDPNSYIPPVQIGDVMRSLGFGVVVESQNPDFLEGTQVAGMTGWTEQLISDGVGLSKVPAAVNAELALSTLGMPGTTAYLGYKEILQAKSGQTLVVSGAAGAVGSVVVQLANADGLRVIAVAGSEEKCRWLKEDLGADGVINYKTDDIASKLAELTPDGIDLFFENTGGPLQHAVIERINPHGRVAVCGLIADYQSAEAALAPSWINLIKRRALIQGFTITDHYHRIPELVSGLTEYLKAGKLQVRTHVINGLAAAPMGVNMLFSGENTGKLIVAL